MAPGTRETPILLDEDEDEEIPFLPGPSKLLVKRFTPITRALSLDGQLCSSSTYLREKIRSDNAIGLGDTDDLDASRVPASLGGRLRASCGAMYKSVRLEADNPAISHPLKRKRSGKDLQSQGSPVLSLGSCDGTIDSDLFLGLSKNQRKRLRKRLRSEGAMMASSVRIATPMSPIHGLVCGLTATPTLTSLDQTVASTELLPCSPSVPDWGGISVDNLPPRNGGPERAVYVGPNWPTHVKKCSNAFIPGPGLGPLAYGTTSLPKNTYNASTGMPPNVYGSSTCAIGKRVHPEPSSGKFPASEDATVFHDPNRTLVLEKLPKRFRSIDFVMQWCRDTAREDDPAPLYINVVRKLGKALIEFTTRERAELAFNSPRLINADGRTQICAFWFRPDSPDRLASASLEFGASSRLSSAASITAPQAGGLTQSVPSGCYDLVWHDEEQVTDALASSTPHGHPIRVLPSTSAPASADEIAQVMNTRVRSRGLNTVPSSDNLTHRLDLRTGSGENHDDDNDAYRKLLDEETDKVRPIVPEDVACEPNINSQKVSPSSAIEGISILQNEPETRIIDQEQSSPELEESAALLVSSIPPSEEQEVTILLTEEDEEDISFSGEGSPQLMYPNFGDEESDSRSASGRRLTIKASPRLLPDSVLGGYVAAYESSPVRGDSTETTKSSREEHLVSSPVQNGPARPMASCNNREHLRTTRVKRTKTSKQPERRKKIYMKRSRFEVFLKSDNQRKRAGRLKAPRKRKLKASTDNVPSSLSSTDQDILMAGGEEAPKEANRDAFICSNAPQEIESLREDVTIDTELAPVYDIARPPISSINGNRSPSPDLISLPSSSAHASPRAERDRGREDERETPQVARDDNLEIPQVSADPTQHFPVSLAALPAAKGSEPSSASDTRGRSSRSLPSREQRNAQSRQPVQTPVRITRSKGAVKTCSKLVSETYIVVPVTETMGTFECISANPSTLSVAEGAKSSTEGNAPTGDQNNQNLAARTPARGCNEVKETAMSSMAIQLESSEGDPLQAQPFDMATITDNTAVLVTDGRSSETGLQLGCDAQSSQSGALVNDFPCAASVNVPVSLSLYDPALTALIDSQRVAREQGSRADDQGENEAYAVPLREDGARNVNSTSAELMVVMRTPVSNRCDFPSPSALLTTNQPDKTSHDAGTQSRSPERNSFPLSSSLTSMLPPSSRAADCLRFVRSTSVVDNALNNGLNVLPVELKWTIDSGSLHPDSVVQNWSLQELQEGRRTVRFRRKLSSNTLYVSCEVIPPGQVNPGEDNVISCICREETQDLWVTSVDLIRLLQGLVGKVFEVEEKNRLRRNFQSFKPLTVSKSSPDYGAFYQRIIRFPQPRPVFIEKDVKVFSWSQFVPIISKVFSKYSLVGPAPSPPVQTSGEMDQPDPSSAPIFHPFLPTSVEFLQQSPCQPANYQFVPEQQLTLLRERLSDDGKEATIPSTVDPRDLTGNDASKAPLPQWPASPLGGDSSSGSTGSLFSSSGPTLSAASLADTALRKSASYFDNLASVFLRTVLDPLQPDALPASQDGSTEQETPAENVSEPVSIDPMLLLLDRQNHLEEHLMKSKTLLAQWEAAQDKSEKARIMALIREEKSDFEARETAADVTSTEPRK